MTHRKAVELANVLLEGLGLTLDMTAPSHRKAVEAMRKAAELKRGTRFALSFVEGDMCL
jgi:hypothetical protein